MRSVGADVAVPFAGVLEAIGVKSLRCVGVAGDGRDDCADLAFKGVMLVVVVAD